MLDVEMAKLELSRKSLSEIHSDTAWKWASRAVAAFEISMTLTGSNRFLKFSEGQEYMGEAKEHASQVSVNLLEQIDNAMGQVFAVALIALDKEQKEKK